MFSRPAPLRTHSARIGLSALAIAAVLATSACSDAVAPEPPASPSAVATAPVDSAAPETSPSAPVEPAAAALVPGGSAQDNLPVFAAVTAAVWATPENLTGRAYIDALVAAGFDKTTMQVTQDESTVGNPAESIQFSVLWQGECLVGQVGPATGAPVTVVVPAVSGGSCLIGATRVIDW